MEDIIRKLARSYQNQMLFARAKDIGSIRLFENDIDFSFIQLKFLQWLQIYESLYSDLYTKESYISAEVIADDLRVDAYLLYKATKKDEPEKEDKKKRQIDSSPNAHSVIFKRKCRK